MKISKKIGRIILLGALIYILICFLMFGEDISGRITESLNICAKTLIPSMFPFLFLTTFIANTDLLSLCPKKVNKFLIKYFHISYSGIVIFFLSCLGGYPIGPKMISRLYEKNCLTNKEANHLILFCVNPAPAFVINVIGFNLCHNEITGIILYFSIVISNILIAIVSLIITKTEYSFSSMSDNTSPLTAFAISGSNASLSMAYICGFYTFFCSVCICVEKTVPYSSLKNFLIGLGEVTSGAFYLFGKVPIYIICFLLAFSDFCVHCQFIEDLKTINCKYSLFLLTRTFSGLLSAVISFILIKVIPNSKPVFENIKSKPTEYSFFQSTILIIGCMIFLLGDFTIENRRKI